METVVIEVVTQYRDDTSGVSRSSVYMDKFAQSIAKTKAQADKAKTSLDKIWSTAKSMANFAVQIPVRVLDYATRPLRSLLNFATSIKGVMMGLFTGVAFNKVVSGPVGLADQIESSRIFFENKLGSKQESEKMLQDIFALDDRSPFDATTLIGSTQRMIGYGWDTKTVLKDLELIGDASAALGRGKEGVEGISRALAEIKLKGKLSAEEMKQLSTWGISGWGYLSKATGKDRKQLEKMVEYGDLSSDMAVKIIMAGMQEYSGSAQANVDRTLSGVLSQVQNVFSKNVALPWGEGLADGLKKGLGMFKEMLEDNKDKISQFGAHLKVLGTQISTWVVDKIEDAGKAMDRVFKDPEFQRADIFGKVRIMWDEVIGDPLYKWWDTKGRGMVSDVSEKIGRGLGSSLKGGILTLMGVNVTGAVADGISIGKGFASGFIQGFDPATVGKAIWGGFTNLFSDAATLLPGGEKTSDTAWISTGILGALGAKLGMFKAIGWLGKNVPKWIGGSSGLGKALSTAGKATTAAAGVTGATAGAGAVIPKVVGSNEAALAALKAANNVAKTSVNGSLNTTFLPAYGFNSSAAYFREGLAFEKLNTDLGIYDVKNLKTNFDTYTKSRGTTTQLSSPAYGNINPGVLDTVSTGAKMAAGAKSFLKSNWLSLLFAGINIAASDNKLKETAVQAGGIGGSIAGGKLGATIGSVFGPVGTVIGGAGGSILGYMGGDALMSEMADAFDPIAQTQKRMEALTGAQKDYLAVAEKNDKVLKLSDRYSQITQVLDKEVKGATLSEEERAKVLSEQHDIVQQLKALYPQIIGLYGDENKELEKKLGLITDIVAAEKESAAMKVGTAQKASLGDFDKMKNQYLDASQQVEKLSKDMSSKIQAKAAMGNIYADAYMLKEEGNLFDKEGHYTTKGAELNEQLNDVFGALGIKGVNRNKALAAFMENYDFYDKTADAKISNTNSEYTKQLARVEEATLYFQSLYDSYSSGMEADYTKWETLKTARSEISETGMMSDESINRLSGIYPEEELFSKWKTLDLAQQDLKENGYMSDALAQAVEKITGISSLEIQSGKQDDINNKLNEFKTTFNKDISDKIYSDDLYEKLTSSLYDPAKKLQTIEAMLNGLPYEKRIDLDVYVNLLWPERDMTDKFGRSINISSNAGFSQNIMTALSDTGFLNDDKKEMVKKLNKITNPWTFDLSTIMPWQEVQNQMLKQTQITPHAEGGLMTKPHLGLVGEAGPEMIIPLSQSRRNRALGLWRETGQMLGISDRLPEFKQPDSISVDQRWNASTATPVRYVENASSTEDTESYQTIQRAPSVTIGDMHFTISAPSGDSQDILKVIKAQMPQIADELAQQIARSLAQSFANTPAKA